MEDSSDAVSWASGEAWVRWAASTRRGAATRAVRPSDVVMARTLGSRDAVVVSVGDRPVSITRWMPRRPGGPSVGRMKRLGGVDVVLAVVLTVAGLVEAALGLT